MKNLFRLLSVALLMVSNVSAEDAVTATVKCGAVEGERQHYRANAG